MNETGLCDLDLKEQKNVGLFWSARENKVKAGLFDFDCNRTKVGEQEKNHRARMLLILSIATAVLLSFVASQMYPCGEDEWV